MFLEIFWDGFHGSPVTVWPRARESSKWVGLGLRPILSGIDPSIPVRVLTHSRGASVNCGALWNLPLREGPESNALYRERQVKIPLPGQLSVRIGLLAPAMPEEDFDTYAPGASCPIERVIVGVNPDDAVLGKKPLPAEWLGSTTLGCDPQAFFSRVSPRVGNSGFLVDLSLSEVHDFQDYLMRIPVEQIFLPLLLDRPPGAALTPGGLTECTVEEPVATRGGASP